ncbi:hypothetical protein ACFVXQ_21040, partial [Kitasatospora sp. NPDC058263]
MSSSRRPASPARQPSAREWSDAGCACVAPLSGEGSADCSAGGAARAREVSGETCPAGTAGATPAVGVAVAAAGGAAAVEAVDGAADVAGVAEAAGEVGGAGAAGMAVPVAPEADAPALGLGAGPAR